MDESPVQEPLPKRCKSEEGDQTSFVTIAPATSTVQPQESNQTTFVTLEPATTNQPQMNISDGIETNQPTGILKKNVKLYSRRTGRPPIIIKIKKVSEHDHPPSYSTVPPTPNVSPSNWNPYDMDEKEDEMVVPIIGRDRLNRYIDTNINVYLSASSCGPYFLDSGSEFEKLSQLCPSTLHAFPRSHSFTEFEKNSNIAKMLCFSDIAAFTLKGSFCELLLSDAKIKFEPALQNNWSEPMAISQLFFDLSNDDIRGQIEAFIEILNRDNSLGAKSHRSLKLFSHLLASAETSQECLLALLNVKAVMQPGTMRDKFLNSGFQILERASRLLNYNLVKNGARVFAFTSESPGILTLNTKPFHIGREPLITFSDARQKRFRLCPLRPCFHTSNEDLIPKMFVVQALSDSKYPRIPNQEYYRRKLHLDNYGTLACSTNNLRTLKGICSFLTGVGNTWVIPFPQVRNANQHTGVTPTTLVEPFLFQVDSLTVCCMIQSLPNRQIRPEYVICGLEDEFKRLHSLELVNKLSLFGASPFLSGLRHLGPDESEIEKLTFEKSVEEKSLTFRHIVGL